MTPAADGTCGKPHSDFCRELGGINAKLDNVIDVQEKILVKMDECTKHQHSLEHRSGPHQVNPDEKPWFAYVTSMFAPLVASVGKALVYAAILIPLSMVLLSQPQVAEHIGDVVDKVQEVRTANGNAHPSGNHSPR